MDELYVKDYEKLHAESLQDPERFWEHIAKELSWFKPWNKVLEWNFPYARWFVGAQCNIVHNALDRHLKTLIKDKLALIWEGQDGSVRKFTYQQLNVEVCKFANALKSLGLKKGDHVSIYLPRIPEQHIAMLACAKIGLVHSVVFSGFSIEALKNRIIDAESTVVICADAYPYKSKIVECKKNVDEAIKDLPQIKHVVVVNRMKDQSSIINHPSSIVSMVPGRDLWWHELVKNQDTICSTEIMEATDPLFILYTSGSTGKPKGVVHSHGGYMVGIYITLKWVFNLQNGNAKDVDSQHMSRVATNYKDSTNFTSLMHMQEDASKQIEDVYFCTADAGWITGHSYIVYSPLINGITTFVYEGTPDYPDPGIWWRLIEKYKITKFYTAPTAVRAMMRLGDEWPNKYNLSSLKILGSVGEPINPEAWLWYYNTIGKKNCPVMDTWWQTETGMFMLTPFPSVTLKPGSAFKPFFGIEADVVDEKGNPVRTDTQGYLVIKTPWPSMFLDVYKNPQKYKEAYFEKIHREILMVEDGKSKVDIEDRRSKEEEKDDSILHPQNPSSMIDHQSSKYPGFLYFTGDSAKKDKDGYFWIIGRNDDVIKVSGHRLGSAELESAFVSHSAVAETAVIGKPDEIKGESIKAFVILKKGVEPTEELKKELVAQVRKMIGPIATPDEIAFVDKLPKTRSGKIMRRVLKAQELGQPLGDTSTLED